LGRSFGGDTGCWSLRFLILAGVVPGGLIADPRRGPRALEEKVSDEVPGDADGLDRGGKS